MKPYTFIPYEFPRSTDGQFIIGQKDNDVLRSRRKQLGLTQKEVAQRAGITPMQYNRLEQGDRSLSSSSLRIGLAVCAVLLLDPYDFLGYTVQQPDPSTMKPQETFEIFPCKDKEESAK